ncbi:hypothetical protein Baya_12380 [Bagarius yarrelli]|uniref:Uncharacterized protein n=1 Tax=Bagarius yarrelli TaxID=175774 RepID=A0A556V2I5_BAGYA|nr:hypothetical protein Baya_12380 [Bagarius yarrelli]
MENYQRAKTLPHVTGKQTLLRHTQKSCVISQIDTLFHSPEQAWVISRSCKRILHFLRRRGAAGSVSVQRLINVRNTLCQTHQNFHSATFEPRPPFTLPQFPIRCRCRRVFTNTPPDHVPRSHFDMRESMRKF